MFETFSVADLTFLSCCQDEKLGQDTPDIIPISTITTNNSKREKAFKACKNYNAVILDKTNKSVVIQITALRREIDKVTKNLKSLGLVSTSRTGAVAMTRGAEVFK